MIARTNPGWWARICVCSVSIVALAWCSAAFVLRVASAPIDYSARVPSTGGERAVSEPAPDSGRRRGVFPMFGDAAATGAKGSVPVVRNAAYSLRGLFAASEGRGFAMIESSGSTALYREQDRLPGGETVAGISSDGVTLQGAQGLGRIEFERAELSSVGSPTEPGEEAPGRDGEAGRAASTAPSGIEHERRPSVSHATLKEQLLAAEPLSRVRFTRVRARNGKIGLRVKWLRRDDLTDLVGLHRGDVILAVNGSPVDDPQAMGTLMETLSDSNEVVLDLERRGEMRRLVIPLSRS